MMGPRECETDMCDKCAELDKRIERYRQIRERVLDPQLAEGIGKLIEEAEAQKAAFHPEQEK
jgi:hypothetical protein